MVCTVYAWTRERWFSQNVKVLHIQNGLLSARGDQNETYQPTDTSYRVLLWCDVMWYDDHGHILFVYRKIVLTVFHSFAFLITFRCYSLSYSLLYSFAANKILLFDHFILHIFSLLSLLVFFIWQNFRLPLYLTTISFAFVIFSALWICNVWNNTVRVTRTNHHQF